MLVEPEPGLVLLVTKPGYELSDEDTWMWMEVDTYSSMVMGGK